MPPTESELYRLFDRAPIGMYRTDEAGKLYYVNPALVRLLGYDSADQLLATNMARDIHVDPAERARVIEGFRPAGFLDRARLRWRTRDGRILTVLIWGHIVETEHGQAFDASVLDVTEQEAMAAELRRQREDLERTASILELVVRQMPAIYWVVDRDLKILRNGGAIEQLFGYSPEQFLGRTLFDVDRTERATTSVALHRRALAGETVSYESEFRGKLLASTLGPYRTADGQVIGVIGTCIDVTAVRQLERRMVDAQRAESLGVLAGGLAHDFNNLLVAVLGNAELALREIPAGTAGRDEIESIRTTGLRAAELTTQLLSYAGRGGAGTRSVHPAILVDELVRILAPSIPKDVTVSVDVPAELVLRGDPTQVHQVLHNLIANARDALGQSGAIAVRGRVERHTGAPHDDDVLPAPPGPYVVLEVSDDGPGMDRDTRRHVFEPFYTTKPTGHGLGLAAVLGIVRAHGGGIRVHSEPGDGTTFEIRWPVATGEAEAASPRPASRTVLVIDDEALVRDVVARMVEDLGYAAVTAADGAAGLDVVSRQQVDAVLVDLTMPQMSGAAVIAALRQRKPGLPVVVCSGVDRTDSIDADAYLPKPFRIEALERTLAKLLPLQSV